MKHCRPVGSQRWCWSCSAAAAGRGGWPSQPFCSNEENQRSRPLRPGGGAAAPPTPAGAAVAAAGSMHTLCRRWQRAVSRAWTGEGGGGAEEGPTRHGPPAPRPSTTVVPRAAGRCAAAASGHRHRGCCMQPRGDHAEESRPGGSGGGSSGGANQRCTRRPLPLKMTARGSNSAWRAGRNPRPCGNGGTNGPPRPTAWQKTRGGESRRREV